MASPVRLSRAELQEIVGKNPKFIRAFEQMESSTSVILPDQVELLLTLLSVASTSAEDAAGAATAAQQAADDARSLFATLPQAVDRGDEIAAIQAQLTAIPELPPDPFTFYALASEDLAAGAIVNVWDNAGVANARNADAGPSQYEAVGWTDTACPSGQIAAVRTAGINSQLSGLIPGSRYFLSDAVPGGVTDTEPGTPGDLRQVLGIAISTSSIPFSYQPATIV